MNGRRGIAIFVFTFVFTGSGLVATGHAEEVVLKTSTGSGTRNVVSFFAEYDPFHFKWEEKKTGVKESGWMHGTRIGVKTDIYRNIAGEGSFFVYGGEVDYKGGTWSGDSVDSNTNYNGWKVEAKVGYPIRWNCTRVTPYMGLGYEYWKRSLENTLSSLGYDEKWKYGTFKVGVRPEYFKGRVFFYTDVYLSYPWKVENRVDLFNVKVKPKKKAGYGIEAGVQARNLFKLGLVGKAGIFYNYDKFGKSDLKYSSVVNSYLFQPESKREIYGFKIGIEF